MNTAFIGLGSNLGDRRGTLQVIEAALRSHVLELTALDATSAVYETKPVGPATEPFMNAVARVNTGLAPLQLLDALLDLEAAHGRVRDARWAARSIDLDLLIYLDRSLDRSLDHPLDHSLDHSLDRFGVEVTSNSERLRLPHPRIVERDFVLAPLVDLGFDRRLANGRTPAETLEALPVDARTIIRRMGVLTSSPLTGG